MRRFLLASLTVVMLFAGPWLASPALADSTYTVSSGDTLWAIATSHGVSVADMVSANDITDPNLIYVGEQLTIPGDTAAPTTPSAPPAPTAPATVERPPATPGSVLADRMVVSYYGNPYTGLMGVLGQLSKEELVAALKTRAAQYEAASGRPCQPAIHFVATVAQASAGSDGMYRARMPYDLVAEYAQLAADNGMLFILDLQFGRSTVQAELAPWLPLLRQPHVHLALDPEFDMWGAERPGADLGHMTAQEINYAQDVLSQIVAENGLPNKILMVYQFTASMLPDKGAIRNDDRVDLVVNMDGFGSSALKIQHYNWYVRDSGVEYAGIKLFLQHDPDLMSPAEVMALTPPPDFVVYQ
ncbi:MAG: LysM domain-containing protein [Dehalococcoidales bacterium]|nr:LysM domain-containing protein [Dehalococcoidales bacterium]